MNPKEADRSEKAGLSISALLSKFGARRFPVEGNVFYYQQRIVNQSESSMALRCQWQDREYEWEQTHENQAGDDGHWVELEPETDSQAEPTV